MIGGASIGEHAIGEFITGAPAPLEFLPLSRLETTEAMASTISVPFTLGVELAWDNDDELVWDTQSNIGWEA